MKKKRSALPLVLVLLMIASCIILLGAGWLLVDLPRQVEARFGPPSGRLSLLQRTRLSFQLLLQQDLLYTPRDPGGAEYTFIIPPGESSASIVQRLESEGLILSAAALTDYLVYAGLDTALQTGKFILSPRMTPLEIASHIQNAVPGEVTFVVLAGWRMEEIAASLPTSGLSITPEQFLQHARRPPAVLMSAVDYPAGATLEGFLFPAAYQLRRETSVEGLITILLTRFQEQVDDELRLAFQNQGLTLYQAVTLASIVQREAVLEEEMPQIASVFFNRLALGMRLESDPTVQYALGYNAVQKTWWTNPLGLTDLGISSPYNTYQQTGLPFGPIANPGLAALRAVAFPAQTDYYYFRAACDGSGRHIFAVNFDEHLRNACP